MKQNCDTGGPLRDGASGSGNKEGPTFLSGDMSVAMQIPKTADTKIQSLLNVVKTDHFHEIKKKKIPKSPLETPACPPVLSDKAFLVAKSDHCSQRRDWGLSDCADTEHQQFHILHTPRSR